MCTLCCDVTLWCDVTILFDDLLDTCQNVMRLSGHLLREQGTQVVEHSLGRWWWGPWQGEREGRVLENLLPVKNVTVTGYMSLWLAYLS